MATKKQTAIHVVLDGIKLTAAQTAAIAKAVNGASLSELARLDLANGVQASIPKKEWRGIFIDRIRAGMVSVTPDTSPAIPVAQDAAKFSVVMGDVPMSAAQTKSMETAIRSAALGELGRRGLMDSVSVRYPKEWFGIWLGKFGGGPVGPR